MAPNYLKFDSLKGYLLQLCHKPAREPSQKHVAVSKRSSGHLRLARMIVQILVDQIIDYACCSARPGIIVTCGSRACKLSSVHASTEMKLQDTPETGTTPNESMPFVCEQTFRTITSEQKVSSAGLCLALVPMRSATAVPAVAAKVAGPCMYCRCDTVDPGYLGH
jgi:hypothetical protein